MYALVYIEEMKNDLFNSVCTESSKYLDGYSCINFREYAEKVIEYVFNIEEFVSCFEKRVSKICELLFKNIGDVIILAYRKSYDVFCYNTKDVGDGKHLLYDNIFNIFTFPENENENGDKEIVSKLFYFFKFSIDSKFKKIAYLISLGNIFNKEYFVLSPKSF